MDTSRKYKTRGARCRGWLQCYNAPTKRAIFDCDGTLVDSQNAIFAAMTLLATSETRLSREDVPA